jgi:hypothetical protein
VNDASRNPFSLAMSGPVVRRGLKFALIVGTVLVTINHGDAIVRGDMTPARWLKAGLTVLVPYCVSVISSVLAVRQQPRPTGD